VTRNPQSDWLRSQEGYFTLIGVLAAIVIIGILFAIYGGGGTTSGSSGAGGTGGAPLGGSVRAARGTVCRNNLAQCRAAISVSAATTGTYPDSLEGLGLGSGTCCPEGGEPYDYDATTGAVHCVHPGHERF